MKNLIVLFFGIMMSTTSLFANNENPIKNQKEVLRNEIIKLLNNHDFPLTEGAVTADVTLLVNKNNELIVVSIKTDNNFLEGYIKRKLNYKKVSVDVKNRIKLFKMPLKIVNTKE